MLDLRQKGQCTRGARNWKVCVSLYALHLGQNVQAVWGL